MAGESEFWRKLVNSRHYIMKNNDGSIGCYCGGQLLKSTNNQDDEVAIQEIMDWVKFNVFKNNSAVSFLIKAMYNRGFGAEFVDCAVVVARNPADAQKVALELANNYFQKHLLKYEPDDVCIRPIDPEELSKYEKLEKIQLTF